MPRLPRWLGRLRGTARGAGRVRSIIRAVPVSALGIAMSVLDDLRPSVRLIVIPLTVLMPTSVWPTGDGPIPLRPEHPAKRCSLASTRWRRPDRPGAIGDQSLLRD